MRRSLAPGDRHSLNRLFLFALALIGSTIFCSNALHAETPGRVVSINACTDQLLWALAPHRIGALTHYSADLGFSPISSNVSASGVKLIRGGAEEVLKLKPNLVLAGSFTRAITRERLAAFGVRVETFEPAESVEAAKADIARAALLLGEEARGAALTAEIDAALAEARARFVRTKLSVLQLRRAAYVSGAGTLFDDVIRKIGADNAASGIASEGARQVTLEEVLKLRPEALALFESIERPGDQGAALLSHPALAAAFPPSRRLVIPGNQIVCGGPYLPQLIRSISAAISEVKK
ncbi:MAG: ABC transporter substrate-binding protein [Chitinophagales bacterium]|nr:ABC transporter substrate-binding protein [Hyphomicrobiales bacterium]